MALFIQKTLNSIEQIVFLNTTTPIAHERIPVIKASFFNSVIIIAYTIMQNTVNKIPQVDLYFLFKSGCFFLSLIRAKNSIIQ